MTFYEIYNRTVMRLWGDTTPPTSAVSLLQGENGLIADAHRSIQEDYNFWFMRAFTYWTTTIDEQTYGLPEQFKEIISAMFKVTGEDYFTSPLTMLKLTEPFSEFWSKETESTEYPEHYELAGEDIILYPAPSHERVFHLIYWTFFERPEASDFIEATSTEDEACKYAGDLISYIAAAEYSLIMKEYDQYSIYDKKAQELLFRIKREDYRRRQAPIQYVSYGEF